MKRILTLILIVAAALILTVTPAFAEKLVADGAPEVTETRLYYYNVTYPSGQILRRFELVPRDSLMVNADGSENFSKKSILNLYFSILSQALKESGYEVALEGVTLTATVTYESLTDLYIAMGETGFSYEAEDGDSGSETEIGFFFTKTQTKMTTVWASADDPETIPGFFARVAFELGETEDNLRFAYLYGTKYRPDAVNSDADAIERIDGIYFHQFVFGAENRSKEITFYQKNPNPTGWYVVAILAGVAIAGGFTAYILIKRKKSAQYA